MSSADRLSFTSFPVWIPVIYFSSLFARTSNTILSKSGESRHPCLVLYPGTNCGFVLYGLYYFELGSLYAHFLEGLLKS